MHITIFNPAFLAYIHFSLIIFNFKLSNITFKTISFALFQTSRVFYMTRILVIFRAFIFNSFSRLKPLNTCLTFILCFIILTMINGTIFASHYTSLLVFKRTFIALDARCICCIIVQTIEVILCVGFSAIGLGRVDEITISTFFTQTIPRVDASIWFSTC